MMAELLALIDYLTNNSESLTNNSVIESESFKIHFLINLNFTSAYLVNKETNLTLTIQSVPSKSPDSIHTLTTHLRAWVVSNIT